VTLSEAATNITLAVAMSGWSTDGEPFFVVVNPGTAKEEKICVKYASSTTLTVVDPAATSTWGGSAAGRGVDGTVDRQHEQGAVIYPVFTALEANQANELVSKYANAGSVVYQGSGTPGTFTELAIGTTAHVLKVNSGGTAPEWGQVATAGIADSAVTSVKIDNNAVTLAKLAVAVQNFLVPVGSITAYGGSAAPTGWLLCNGATFSAVTYPNLNTVLGGNTLPNFVGRVPMGKTASGTGSTLLGVGGSNTIAEGNLPSHLHGVGTLDAAPVGDHSHTGTVDPAGGHGHTAASVTAGSHSHTTTSPGFGVGINRWTPNATPSSGWIYDNPTGAAGDHSHSITVDAVGNHQHTFTSVGGGAHDHTISGSTGLTGSGTAYFQPFLSVNYIIKHD
jgi:microcystin-dependent protein